MFCRPTYNNCAFWVRHFDSDCAGKRLMHSQRSRRLDRDEGVLQGHGFLRMQPYPFMNKVGVEVVAQCDTRNRGVRLCALGNDLGLERPGIGTAFLWHGLPLKRLKMVST